MELTKFNGNYAPGLTEVQKKAVEMSKSQKIKELKVNEIGEIVGKAMKLAYAIKGFSSLTDDFKRAMSIVIEKLKNDYPHTSVGEVVHAIELGSYGQFNGGNELNVVSPQNIISWINSYKELVRKEAVSKQIEFEEKQRIEAEKAKHEQKLAEFEAFIENGILNGFEDNIGVKAAVYRHLDKKGRIKLSKDEKMAIWDMANEYYNSLPKDFDGNITGYLFTLKDVAESKALDYWIFNNQ